MLIRQNLNSGGLNFRDHVENFDDQALLGLINRIYGQPFRVVEVSLHEVFTSKCGGWLRSTPRWARVCNESFRAFTDQLSHVSICVSLRFTSDDFITTRTFDARISEITKEA